MIGEDDEPEKLREQQQAVPGQLHPALNEEGIPTGVKGLNQKGLFSLVWYECACSAKIRAYNKRQLAPPKYIICSSCGGRMRKNETTMEQRWAHKPYLGQVCIKDFTWYEAKGHAELLNRIRMAQGEQSMDEVEIEMLTVLIYGDGHRPMTYVFAGPGSEERNWVERAGPPDGAALDSLMIFNHLSGATGLERSKALRQFEFMDTILGNFETSGQGHAGIFGPEAEARGEHRAAKIKLKAAQIEYARVRAMFPQNQKQKQSQIERRRREKEEAALRKETERLLRKAARVEKDTKKIFKAEKDRPIHRKISREYQVKLRERRRQEKEAGKEK